MIIEELRSAIESYPHRLYVAMAVVDKAEKAVEQLNGLIEEEEFNLSPSLVEETRDSEEEDNENIQETLVKLDHELALLEVCKLRLSSRQDCGLKSGIRW